MKLAAVFALGLILMASIGVHAQQRPSRKPTPPAVSLQPPSPSDGQTGGPPQSQSTNSQNQTERDQRSAPQVPVVVEIHNAPKTEAEAAEAAAEKERKASSDWWTIFLAGALVFATAMQFIALLYQGWQLSRSVHVAAQAADEARHAIKATQASAAAASAQARAARDANRINRDLLVATQRPWISIELIPSGALIYRNDGAYLQITCAMTNIGSTPALYAWPHVQGILQGSENAVLRQRIIMQEFEQDQSGIRQLGHAVFPGQPVSVLTAILIKNEEIDRFQPSGADRKILQIAIVGFIRYKPTFDNFWRYTGFSYGLYRKDIDNVTGTGVHPTFYKDAGEIEPADLTLRPWYVDGDCFFAT